MMHIICLFFVSLPDMYAVPLTSGSASRLILLHPKMCIHSKIFQSAWRVLSSWEIKWKKYAERMVYANATTIEIYLLDSYCS